MLLGSAYFFPLQDLIEMFPLTKQYAMIFSVLMFLPFWFAVVLERRKFDFRVWCGLGIVGLLSYLYEWVSINFGFPYGKFEYTEMMGGLKVFGDVPLVLPLIYIPMVFGMVYVLRNWKDWKRVFGVGVGLMLFDVAIDPGITASQIWIWGDAWLPGRLYDVPVQNFLGWFLTGSLSAWVLWRFVSDEFWDGLSKKLKWIWFSGVGFSLAYWGGVALRERYLISLIVAGGLMILCVLNLRKNENLCL